MNDTKKLKEKYNKGVISKITDYIKKNELFLSNVLCDTKETGKMIKTLKLEKIG